MRVTKPTWPCGIRVSVEPLSAGASLLCKEVAKEWEKFVTAGSNLYRLCFHRGEPVWAAGRPGSLQRGATIWTVRAEKSLLER
jgi:hypothetical protein